MSCKFICDGCGKEAEGMYDARGIWFCPGFWFQNGSGAHACGKFCRVKVNMKEKLTRKNLKVVKDALD